MGEFGGKDDEFTFQCVGECESLSHTLQISRVISNTTCSPKYEFFYPVCKSQSTYWVEILDFITILQNRVPATEHS